MSARVDDLVALLTEAGGAVRPYDPRLEPFEQDGSLDAALTAGRVVETPSTIEIPDEQPRRNPAVDLLLALVAAAACLIAVGESLSWWNLWPENPRRGDWVLPKLDASREPFVRPDAVPAP